MHLKGVTTVSRRYTKGVCLLQNMIDKSVRAWTSGQSLLPV